MWQANEEHAAYRERVQRDEEQVRRRHSSELSAQQQKLRAATEKQRRTENEWRAKVQKLDRQVAELSNTVSVKERQLVDAACCRAVRVV